MKYAVIVGTRPEIIKMSPVIRELERRGLEHFVLHTGQHYSYEMDRIFFDEINLKEPDYNLDVGSGSHGEQTGKMLAGIEQILVKEKPGIVIVEGDTNTVLAGALAAAKLHIKVGHVEAGLRSFDRAMPEEINRILTDYCSDFLYAPTEGAANTLIRGGIPREKVFLTGNTIVDAVEQNIRIARQKADILNKLGLEPRRYFLVTCHRQENVDNPGRLKGILQALEEISKKYPFPIIFPIHPRTQKKIAEYSMHPKGVRTMDPVGFLEFLQLEAGARLVLTDSGGVQEETCILRVPCVTLRDNTERPETLEAGSNVLVGADTQRILEGVEMMLEKERGWTNPFGDGTSARKIIDSIEESK